MKRIKNIGTFISKKDYERLVEYDHPKFGPGYILPVKKSQIDLNKYRDEIIELLKTDTSQRDIAKKYNTTVYNLRKFMSQNNITRKGQIKAD